MFIAHGPSSQVASPRLRWAKGHVTPRKTEIAGAFIPSKYSAIRGRCGFSSFVHDDVSATAAAAASTGDVAAGHSHANPASPAAPSPRDSLPSGRGELENRPAFRCRASLPPAPKQAGAFQRFRYSVDPFELAEDQKRNELRQKRTKTLAGAFAAGGNARDGKRGLKRRMPELRKQLTLALRADWSPFLKIAVDERGVLLALFASEGVTQERKADLHAYMNRLLTTHPTSTEFGLNRDPSRWGAMLVPPLHGPGGNATVAPAQALEAAPGGTSGAAPAAPPIVYAFRPPWVPNDLMLAHRLLEQQTLGANVAAGGSHRAPSQPSQGGLSSRRASETQ